MYTYVLRELLPQTKSLRKRSPRRRIVTDFTSYKNDISKTDA